MLPGVQEIFYKIDQHIVKENNMKPKNLVLAWINYKKAKMDNRLSQIIQDIMRSHKVYRKYH